MNTERIRSFSVLSLLAVLLISIAVCGCAGTNSTADNMKTALVHLGSVPDRDMVMGLSSLTQQQRNDLTVVYDKSWPPIQGLIDQRIQVGISFNSGHLSNAECQEQYNKLTTSIKDEASKMTQQIVDKLTPDQVSELYKKQLSQVKTQQAQPAPAQNP